MDPMPKPVSRAVRLKPGTTVQQRGHRAMPRGTTQEAERIALYLRVANSLRSRINDGEWKPGDQLPIIKHLAKDYQVALVTVRQALQILAQDELIEGNQGRGTFVCDGARPVRGNPALRAAINDRLSLPAGCTIEILGRELREGDDLVFAPPDTPRHPAYIEVQKLHLQDGEPFALMQVWVAQPIYQRFPDGADAHKKLLRLIIENAPIRLRRSRIEMMVTYADPTAAALLRCPAMSALVRIRSYRVDEHGTLAFGHVAYYRADRFIYEVEEYEAELEKSTAVVMPGTRKRGQPSV